MLHDVLLVVHDVLQVFHDVLRCLVSRATIGIAAARRDRENAAGIGDNSAVSAEIGDDAAGIVDIAAKVIPC